MFANRSRLRPLRTNLPAFQKQSLQSFPQLEPIARPARSNQIQTKRRDTQMSTAYEIVTEFIIKQLESGVAPWRKPWGNETPANLSSKKEYRGINIFLLASRGYGSRYWLPIVKRKHWAEL
jgi:hypothetical protein